MTTIDPGVTGRRSGGTAHKAFRRPGALAPSEAPSSETPKERKRALTVRPQAPRKEAPLTMSVPEAGKKYYGLSKNSSYDAAARGDIPTIRVGKLLRVPVRLMERKLDEAGEEQAFEK